MPSLENTRYSLHFTLFFCVFSACVSLLILLPSSGTCCSWLCSISKTLFSSWTPCTEFPFWILCTHTITWFCQLYHPWWRLWHVFIRSISRKKSARILSTLLLCHEQNHVTTILLLSLYTFNIIYISFFLLLLSFFKLWIQSFSYFFHGKSLLRDKQSFFFSFSRCLNRAHPTRKCSIKEPVLL